MSYSWPLEMPYWITPRPHSSNNGHDENPPKPVEAKEGHPQAPKQQNQSLHETLAHFLHVFNLHHSSEPFEHGMANPRADILEDKTAYTLLVELPGLGHADVHVEVDDHRFTVGFSGRLSRLPSSENRGPVSEPGNVAVEHEGAPDAGQGSSLPVKEDAEQAKQPIHSGRRFWAPAERQTGAFRRVLQLPIGCVNMEGVKASILNGLLTVTVPKREGATEAARTTRHVTVVPGCP
jgi:HSP20 family molecular chaperone IbpA